jgi:choline-sulfatase
MPDPKRLAAKKPAFIRTVAIAVHLLVWPTAFGAETGPVVPEAPARRNVLMIVVDDLRDEIGCFGNPLAKTPNIDRLGGRGIVFDRAYCQQAVCSPSRTSLLTGQRPDVTRVWDLKTHFRRNMPDCVTLPQAFKESGYHCAALGKVYHRGYEDGRSWSEPHWYPNGKTVDTDPADWTKHITRKYGQGVEEYADGTVENKSGKGPAFEVSMKSDDELPDGFTAAEAVRRLAACKQTDRPFFLAVGFLKPHLPFVAPKRYWDLHEPEAIPVPSVDRLPAGAPPFAGHDNGELHQYDGIPAGNPIPTDVARTLRHGYYACVSYADAQIGRLLDALERENLADNTIVVLWGDHGWQLGEHGLWQKHTNFERATRAPLIIAAPGIGPVGRRCSAPVEFVDVYPTLADACGLKAPAGLAGTSLVPLLRAPTASVKPVAISQYPRKVGDATDVPVMGYSVRDDRWRLTVWREDGGTRVVATELYDERDDPGESRNLASAPEHEEVVTRLSKHLPPPGPRFAKAPGKSATRKVERPE